MATEAAQSTSSKTARTGGGDKLVGPLHAVEGTSGREAAERHTEVQALCGEWVLVVPVEDVPDDTGLCPACQYGS